MTAPKPSQGAVEVARGLEYRVACGMAECDECRSLHERNAVRIDAFAAEAVLKLRRELVRSDIRPCCAEAVAREREACEAAVDGWRLTGPSHIGPLHGMGWNEAIARAKAAIAARAKALQP